MDGLTIFWTQTAIKQRDHIFAIYAIKALQMHNNPPPLTAKLKRAAVVDCS